MASSFDKLPTDALSSILLLFPAKELCRLRAVCRSWRTLTSDAAFIRAHADRHKETQTLFLAKFQDDERTHLNVVDLSGNIVKRIAGADGCHQVLRTRLDLACLFTVQNRCRVLNPATGGIRQVLPLAGTANIRRGTVCNCSTTGEYKLLRCLDRYNPRGPFVMFGALPIEVQVLTINGGGGGGSTDTDHARWRPRPAPPLSIDERSGVVVDGVVYFLTSEIYDASAGGGMPADYSGILPLDLERWWADIQDGSASPFVGDAVFDNLALHHANNAGVPADYIISFDLASEEWRRDLHGPSSTGNLTSGQMLRSHLTLADLKGYLVLAHHPRSMPIMDLWFLLDFDTRLWEKQYSIQTDSLTSSLAGDYRLIPLLALGDGRLVIHLAMYGQLFICDPGTNTFTRVDIRHYVDSVGVYTGSLLSLQEGNL